MTPPTVKQAPLTYCYSFDDLNKDLDELYEILKQENYKNEEIYSMLDPIFSTRLSQNETKANKIIESVCKGVLIILSLIVTIYLLTYWDTFYWNLTALTRIFMIKILPLTDWRPLKNEPCLVRRFFDQYEQKISQTQSEEIFNCDLCDSLKTFEQITYDIDHDIEDLIRKFIDIDRPIVVKGGLEHWLKKSPQDFIDELIKEREFSRSIPCKIRTDIDNLRRDEVEVGALIKKTEYFNRFFMHFQNCDLEAVKVFRKHTYRPKVLPDELSPVTYNWLLWNNNSYNTMKFKKIDLMEKYTIIGQIFGSTTLKLVPRKNCENVCPSMEGILPNGHFLVLTSLWDVEYLPADNGENLAAILEIKG